MSKQIKKALADLARAADAGSPSFYEPQALARVLTLDQLDTLIQWLGEIRDAQDEDEDEDAA